MKKTGQILKEARESNSISLQEISIHLKINTKTLKALEVGDRAQLPAKTFLRGFVQSYAQFLKIDLNHIMEVFQEEMGSTHPGMITTQTGQVPQNNVLPGQTNHIPTNNINAHFQSIPNTLSSETKANTSAKAIDQNKTANLNTKNSSKNLKSSANNANAINKEIQLNEPLPPSISFDPQTWSHSLKIGTAILVLLIISIIIGLKKTIDKYEREATLPKQEDQQLETIINSAIPNIKSQSLGPTQSLESANADNPTSSTSSEGTISQNLNISPAALNLTSKPILQPEDSPMPVPAATNTDTEKTTDTLVQAPTISPTALEIKNPATAATAAAATAAQPILSPSPSSEVKEALIEGPQEVIIEALDKVTVTYSIDGGPKNSIPLSPEKIHTFKAQKKILLSFSDGGSVNLIHNGKDKGIPGNLGQAYTVSFPK